MTPNSEMVYFELPYVELGIVRDLFLPDLQVFVTYLSILRHVRFYPSVRYIFTLMSV